MSESTGPINLLTNSPRSKLTALNPSEISDELFGPNSNGLALLGAQLAVKSVVTPGPSVPTVKPIGRFKFAEPVIDGWKLSADSDESGTFPVGDTFSANPTLA